MRIHVIELVNDSYTIHNLLNEDNDLAFNEAPPLLMYKSYLHYDAIVLKSVTSYYMNVEPPNHTLSDTVLPADDLAANADRAAAGKTVSAKPMRAISRTTLTEIPLNDVLQSIIIPADAPVTDSDGVSARTVVLDKSRSQYCKLNDKNKSSTCTNDKNPLSKKDKKSRSVYNDFIKKSP